MPQFVSYNSNIEVNGYTIQSFIKGVTPLFRQKIISILADNDINNLEKDNWYNQQNWLDAFKQIYETIGEHTLFSIGKSIPDSAIFPDYIKNLKDALASIDIAYHENHRGGEIGYYRLIKYNSKKREAIMECKNPYPDAFNQGIITSIVRKFKPTNSLGHEVKQGDKASENIDPELSTYLIRW